MLDIPKDKIDITKAFTKFGGITIITISMILYFELRVGDFDNEENNQKIMDSDDEVTPPNKNSKNFKKEENKERILNEEGNKENKEENKINSPKLNFSQKVNKTSKYNNLQYY